MSVPAVAHHAYRGDETPLWKSYERPARPRTRPVGLARSHRGGRLLYRDGPTEVNRGWCSACNSPAL